MFRRQPACTDYPADTKSFLGTDKSPLPSGRGAQPRARERGLRLGPATQLPGSSIREQARSYEKHLGTAGWSYDRSLSPATDFFNTATPSRGGWKYSA